jgi:hypothetical protein
MLGVDVQDRISREQERVQEPSLVFQSYLLAIK